MTDKELLELAAKAAGLKLDEVHLAYLEDEQTFIRHEPDSDGISGEWNPLLSDADAFKLMVKLNLFVCIEDHEVEIFQSMNPEPLSGEYLPDPKGKDYVVRACIVVAAAQIGKGM